MAVRIIDPGRDLQLPKDATLEQIAIAVSGGSSVEIGQRTAVKVAGLDGASISLTDNANRLYSQTFAFRLPELKPIGSVVELLLLGDFQIGSNGGDELETGESDRHAKDRAFFGIAKRKAVDGDVQEIGIEAVDLASHVIEAAIRRHAFRAEHDA